jgi:hypothetical protein
MTRRSDTAEFPLIVKVLLGILLVIPLLIFLLFVIVVQIIYILWGLLLSIIIRAVWGVQGKYILFIHSNSPIWSKYIEEEILPVIQDKAIILNWSERKKWKNYSLAVIVFRYFKDTKNFNPLAIVFKPFHLNQVFRFYEAFHQYKSGKVSNLENIKNKFLDSIA